PQGAAAVVRTMNIDPFPHDPFFKRGPSIEWNACIGRKGDEKAYVLGYMEAAIELVSAVIDKQQHGKRDTLAMPILYTARHAVELTLKFCARRLAAQAMQAVGLQHSHDVSSLWNLLKDANIGDREIAHHISELKPYVESLAAIDDDGQE